MIIQCKSCSRKFIVKDNDIPNNGRMVQCGYCDKEWKQFPVVAKEPKVVKLKDPGATKSAPQVKKARKRLQKITDFLYSSQVLKSNIHESCPFIEYYCLSIFHNLIFL